MTRSTINQNVQYAAEATPGTAVAANKFLECFSWQFGIEVSAKFFGGTGRKYDSIQELNKEWSGGSMDGEMDYNGLIVPLSGAFGSTTPVNSGASTTAKDWVFTPPLTGNTALKTFSFEQGDASRAQKFAYGLFTQWGYKGTRDDFTTSAKLIGRKITDGATMTASPTVVPLATMVASQFNLYMDATSAGLGTTQLTRPISLEFDMSDIYGPTWFINRTQASYTDHVDLKPNCTFKMMLEADAAGMAMLNNLRAGDTQYIRVEGVGNTIDAPNNIKNTFKHDMAVKFSKPSPWQDADGIFAIEWEAQIVEDTTWGKAHTLTLTNLLTSL